MAVVAFSGPLEHLPGDRAAITFKLITMAYGFLPAELAVTLLKTLGFAVVINLLLAVFNLIPVFPLDGSQIALGLLKGRALEIYEKHLPYGVYIIIGLMVSGLLPRLMHPVLSLALLLMTPIMGAF